MLAARGELMPGDRFRHSGILDTVFTGNVTGETTVGDLPAITCTVTGSAYLTGTFNFFLDPNDPFPNGFRMQPITVKNGEVVPFRYSMKAKEEK